MSLAANIGHAAEAGSAWPRIGAFSYGFERDQLQPLITGFARHGLSAVQLGSGLLDQALENPTARTEIRELLEANGIQIAGLAGYRNLIAPDPDTRRANLDHLKRCLEIAPELGTSTVATETGTRHPTNDWLPVPENAGEPAWSLFYAALDELLPVAERNGVSLSLEGYVSNVVRSFADVGRVLERFPTPALQIVLDPYNYLSRDLVPDSADLTADFLRRFDQHFTLAHLKDVSQEGAENETPEFGLGVFPQEVFLEYLHARRPELPLIFEHLPFDHIPGAVERLHALLTVKA
ncbi:MAG TPA: sugar phosphate isomerase/epimerase family protein [Chloroflexota bacterium]|nr:sugar phosphate isomerase/epimerase family protein [Chloroflexota bacterium]